MCDLDPAPPERSQTQVCFDFPRSQDGFSAVTCIIGDCQVRNVTAGTRQNMQVDVTAGHFPSQGSREAFGEIIAEAVDLYEGRRDDGQCEQQYGGVEGT